MSPGDKQLDFAKGGAERATAAVGSVTGSCRKRERGASHGLGVEPFNAFMIPTLEWLIKFEYIRVF